MVMCLHIDAQAIELDTLGLQAHTLLKAMLTDEQYLSFGSDNALPWDAASAAV